MVIFKRNMIFKTNFIIPYSRDFFVRQLMEATSPAEPVSPQGQCCVISELRESRDRWSGGISPVQEREEPEPKVKSRSSHRRRDAGSFEVEEVCLYLLGEGRAKGISV